MGSRRHRQVGKVWGKIIASIKFFQFEKKPIWKSRDVRDMKHRENRIGDDGRVKYLSYSFNVMCILIYKLYIFQEKMKKYPIFSEEKIKLKVFAVPPKTPLPITDSMMIYGTRLLIRLPKTISTSRSRHPSHMPVL